ncbi:hypothetical protein B1992_06610 [Pseudoxanthomonas broegbernensis]|uniref:Uncharacterized protein n=1 Tax=Pseudoxanthomonas broegbernensis TaxID=83619 RepID=A0A7V8GMN0_9GAMM|nr:hypothetical protein [Pseudoxanthomonas broegbernensis]KAF1686579.1 hypothetical protein B1992_06610 [Pseudoxanthomonas broegbernensis]
MSRPKPSAPSPAATACDDDVADLFARLGARVGDGGYHDFSARLEDAPIAAVPGPAAARPGPVVPAPVPAAAEAPRPVSAVPPGVVQAEPGRDAAAQGAAKSSLERLFQRLAEGGPASPEREESPLRRMRFP